MIVTFRLRTAFAAVILIAAACTDAPSAPAGRAPVDDPQAVLAARSLPRFGDWVAARVGTDAWTPPSAWPVLVGAGDIAECYQPPVPPPLAVARAQAATSPAAATAALLDRIPGTVIALGDNAYEFGSPFDYAACYDPTWGRHRQRTRPAAGNHEYFTPGAAGYFTYFPERSAPPLGYYSYEVGSWHIVVLNSTPQVYMCYPPEVTEVVRDPRWPAPQLESEPTSAALGRLCAGDVAQQAWLIDDLSTHSAARCTAVYFHHPRFSSGSHGNHYQMQRIWDIMYAFGVDLVLSGHDHDYERFAPQNPDGVRDPAFGIREIVVGTGGASLRSVSARVSNSEVLITGRHGVVAVGLGSGGYGWAFIATDRSVLDAGSASCHGAPSPVSTPPFASPG